MDFVEEKTPAGNTVKIMLKKWQYLVFTRKGESIYGGEGGKSILHNVPRILFAGTSFAPKRNYLKKYYLLRASKGRIIVPYEDIIAKRTKYFFINFDTDVDAVPARIFHVSNIASMIREIDIKQKPDYVIIDHTITDNDTVIIKGRYKVEHVLRVEKETLRMEDDREKLLNLNMMSNNAVFLSRIHMRNMELSKINQLLLDFELTALDTEYILNLIEKQLKSEDASSRDKSRPMLEELSNSFRFYRYLLMRDDEGVRSMIESQTDARKMTPFSTLISKVKSIYPNREEQILYAEYEQIVAEKIRELTGGQETQTLTEPESVEYPEDTIEEHTRENNNQIDESNKAEDETDKPVSEKYEELTSQTDEGLNDDVYSGYFEKENFEREQLED